MLLCLSLPLFGQDVASFEKRVTVTKLTNGLTVILIERHDAPVFSFATFVDAGSSQDPLGKTGLAHMMEHMAFKGTDEIGTGDFAAEKLSLEKLEAAYAAYNEENQKSFDRDEKKLAELEKAWKDAIAEADKHVVKNEFGEIVEREGGEDLNAYTNLDETVYFYSLPANRIELWAYLESSRFLHPVLRQFYTERDVVTEERRMRTDSNPVGRLEEQFTAMAFDGSPYHRPTIGYASDLKHFSATDAKHFFATYYVPSNITIAVAGDIDPNKMLPLLEKYFGRIPASPKPQEYEPKDPPQDSTRSVTLQSPSQPIYLEGYHRPDYRDPDDAVYDALTDLLSDGRTSRLYRALVRDKKLALAAGGESGYPGTKYPHLFIFYGVPAPNHTNQEVAAAIHAEIERLKTEDVSDAELQMFKTRARASIIRSLDDNSTLARMLAEVQARYGDWHELFNQLGRIDKVSKADIRRVANTVFTDNNRTTGASETAKPAAQGGQQ
jgi:predicted Zn-dependent peptidase